MKTTAKEREELRQWKAPITEGVIQALLDDADRAAELERQLAASDSLAKWRGEYIAKLDAVVETAKTVVTERRARIMHARESTAMCRLDRALTALDAAKKGQP